jgi:hypothetical protein
MDIYEESKALIQIINKVQEQNSKDNLFKGLEVRKESSNVKLPNSNLSKNKRPFRITNLLSVIEFLDLNSILRLSEVNRQSYHFIKSIYFYKFLHKAKQSKKKSNKTDNKIKENLEEGPGLLSKLSNYFGNILLI